MGIPKHWERLKTGDHFTFTVKLVREDDSIIEQLAGANNVDAAQAAFETLPGYYSKRDILRIRQGSRIMNRVRGTDEDRLAMLARMRGKRDGWREQDVRGWCQYPGEPLLRAPGLPELGYYGFEQDRQSVNWFCREH